MCFMDYLPRRPQILLKKARKIISIATPANNPIIIANVFSPSLPDLPAAQPQGEKKSGDI